MWMSMLGGSGTEKVLCLEPAASSPWLVAGCLAATLVATLWAVLERRERRIECRALSTQNSELSEACRTLTEHHYRERVQAEERHLLSHDSSVRNILESLERALLGKPKS